MRIRSMPEAKEKEEGGVLKLVLKITFYLSKVSHTIDRIFDIDIQVNSRLSELSNKHRFRISDAPSY